MVLRYGVLTVCGTLTPAARNRSTSLSTRTGAGSGPGVFSHCSSTNSSDASHLFLSAPGEPPGRLPLSVSGPVCFGLDFMFDQPTLGSLATPEQVARQQQFEDHCNPT